jgi:hypothetical protein
MEDIKLEYSISEYSVSQTSLEQIFNNFAKLAEKGVSYNKIKFLIECEKENHNYAKS